MTPAAKGPAPVVNTNRPTPPARPAKVARPPEVDDDQAPAQPAAPPAAPPPAAAAPAAPAAAAPAAPAVPASRAPAASLVGTNVGTPVPALPQQQLDLTALMHGRVDPDDDRAQTGVRLPRYLVDVVRTLANTSRGKLTMQDIVTAAVKAYLPADVVRQAYAQHGGAVDDPADVARQTWGQHGDPADG